MPWDRNSMPKKIDGSERRWMQPETDIFAEGPGRKSNLKNDLNALKLRRFRI
jgi:hypothetical protein